jgi:hypothetical protein
VEPAPAVASTCSSGPATHPSGPPPASQRGTPHSTTHACLTQLAHSNVHTPPTCPRHTSPAASKPGGGAATTRSSSTRPCHTSAPSCCCKAAPLQACLPMQHMLPSILSQPARGHSYTQTPASYPPRTAVDKWWQSTAAAGPPALCIFRRHTSPPIRCFPMRVPHTGRPAVDHTSAAQHARPAKPEGGGGSAVGNSLTAGTIRFPPTQQQVVQAMQRDTHRPDPQAVHMFAQSTRLWHAQHPAMGCWLPVTAAMVATCTQADLALQLLHHAGACSTLRMPCSCRAIQHLQEPDSRSLPVPEGPC